MVFPRVYIVIENTTESTSSTIVNVFDDKDEAHASADVHTAMYGTACRVERWAVANTWKAAPNYQKSSLSPSS